MYPVGDLGLERGAPLSGTFWTALVRRTQGTLLDPPLVSKLQHSVYTCAPQSNVAQYVVMCVALPPHLEDLSYLKGLHFPPLTALDGC